MFVPAAVALDPQESVFEQTALQVILKLLAHEARKMTTGTLDLLYEARVVFDDDGIENSLFRTMAVIGRWGGKRGRWEH